jgi:hypothetical protein
MKIGGRTIRYLLVVFMVTGLSVLGGGAVSAQVLDADCFSGACGGTKGIPQCPEGYGEVGFVLYANSKANETSDCETVVSCTNLGKRSVDISCRFFHGFNPIRNGDPANALCSTLTEDLAPGDTTECATDATAPPNYQAAKIFLGADGDCPTFEGKGLICAKGDSADNVFCEAHLACGNGTVLENLTIATRKGAEKNGRGPENGKGNRNRPE